MPEGWQLPSLYELVAAPHWQAVEFISDLHLADADGATFAAWARHMRSTRADAVLILGDLFEAWVGDDARGEPFEAACVDVLADASSRLQVGFMVGNRDFLVGGAMLRDAGAIGLQDPTLLVAFGRRVLLTHGDLLCLADVEYQRFREQARSDAWRRAALAMPIAQRRVVARQMRDASQQRQQGAAATTTDVDPGAAVAWMHAAGCSHMVHGHTHRPGDETLAVGHERHVLSDWDLDASPPRAEVLRLTRDGFSRVPPVG
ncbi:UDP-2,3-diacylglucosamine diphosphatase [Azohydromonas sp.]|uniref:UDP-2,3-diacylglucosamine diphosphatase n=1 Tax=Azohydromonas sp. TaxID=1872666 RepID=UPI002C56671E|nr:UDP-2,3-diacylglucosamine diphosphatase [Azohydromonas sp.]HMM85792.1 UDP-2,3-diacylglucosamine diphosphatase [Azohydromonas sp.]